MKEIIMTLSVLTIFPLTGFASGGKHFELQKNACENKKPDEVCSFVTPKGERDGICLKSKKDTETLLCKKPRKKRGDFKVLSQLNLSNEQLEKLAKFKKEHDAKRKKLKGDRRDEREEMKKLFLSNSPDKELMALHEKIHNQRGEHGKLRVEKMIFLKNLLNDDQRKAYMESRKEGKRRDKEEDN